MNEATTRLDARLPSLDSIMWDWGCRCFGEAHMRDPSIRALRMIEEAIEAGQALGLAADLLHKQVDAVYARPHGEISKEMGGVLMTARLLCHALGLAAKEVLVAESRRVLAKDPGEFARRNQQKLDLGLDTRPEPSPNTHTGGGGGTWDAASTATTEPFPLPRRKVNESNRQRRLNDISAALHNLQLQVLELDDDDHP